MTRVIFVRHGESLQNLRGVVSSAVPGASLSPEGVAQARALAVQLKSMRPSAIYASPALRAAQTAQQIADACALPLILDERLVELNVGSVEGMPAAEGLRILDVGWDSWIDDGDFDLAVAEGGESAAEVLNRFKSFLSDIETAHLNDDQIVVVAHGGILQLSLPVLCLNLDNGHGRREWLRNTQTVEAHTVPGGLVCERWANTVI